MPVRMSARTRPNPILTKFPVETGPARRKESVLSKVAQVGVAVLSTGAVVVGALVLFGVLEFVAVPVAITMIAIGGVGLLGLLIYKIVQYVRGSDMEQESNNPRQSKFDSSLHFSPFGSQSSSPVGSDSGKEWFSRSESMTKSDSVARFASAFR